MTLQVGQKVRYRHGGVTLLARVTAVHADEYTLKLEDGRMPVWTLRVKGKYVSCV